jgi:hypothetical protein
MSPCLTVPLLFCVYFLLRNVCLASRWLAKDFRVCSLPRERVLPNNRIVGGVVFCTLRIISKESQWVCLANVARQFLGKHVPAATKNCWRRHFLCGPCRVTEVDD